VQRKNTRDENVQKRNEIDEINVYSDMNDETDARKNILKVIILPHAGLN
jgi:hypothetical protein